METEEIQDINELLREYNIPRIWLEKDYVDAIEKIERDDIS